MNDPRGTFEFIRAVRECEELTIEYLPTGGKLQRVMHDEDVSDYSEQECREVAQQLLDLTDEESKQIEYFDA